MATEAQIAANRLNAQKSTGPTSPDGKVSSSRNSSKHGLAGSTTAALIASESDRALLEERKRAWSAAFAPEGKDEEWLFERLVAESIRVERYADAYFALCRDHGRRARTQWDADRRREADELGSRLAKSPQTVARRIEATYQGAEMMLEYWRGLSASLERHKTWTDAQRSLALNLLGIHPELRDAETPVDPSEGDAFEARRALVAAEVARLTDLRDGELAERDDDERELAESTIGAELTKPLQLMHRYERAAWSRQQWAWRKLDAARKARQGDAPPAPLAIKAPPAVRPQPAPAPRPAPPPPTSRPAPAPARSSFVRISATPTPAPTAPAIDRGTFDAILAETAPDRGPNRRERRAEAVMVRQAVKQVLA